MFDRVSFDELLPMRFMILKSILVSIANLLRDLLCAKMPNAASVNRLYEGRIHLLLSPRKIVIGNLLKNTIV